METKEGKGFMIHRSFLSHSLSDFDQFLLHDETDPIDLKPKEANGAPDHSHRGFETVTYAISGNIEHKDSQGHSGKLSPGDVRWMTTGSRVIHSEMPTKEFVDKGGRLHGFQLWVNLSKNDKMTKYSYQDIPSLNIPIIKIPDEKGVVRVIAGQAFGNNSIIKTRIPIRSLA
ncbi:MAG TPA: pirin family protein [Verrucomicrobiae bacterium]|nr:pirin family protein [Verrucomicrobiae bacterium]